MPLLTELGSRGSASAKNMPLLRELSPTGRLRQLSVRSGIFIATVPPGHQQLRSGMFIETDTQTLRFELEITEITESWLGRLVCR